MDNKDEKSLLEDATGEGGYIFISHSHYDIKKVRQIRNTLEENGFEPLCFYLKCLNDDDEVEGLIKREIDARDIFLYIDSENARQSKWVKKERKYINSCTGKTIYTINIEDKQKDLKQETLKILDMSRVFISYSIHQQAIFQMMSYKFMSRDLKVFGFSSIPAGSSFIEAIKQMIKEACQRGCFVTIVSKESLRSEACAFELQLALDYASKENTPIIPVVIDDVELDMNNPLHLRLQRYNCYRLGTHFNLDIQLNDLAEIVKDVLKKKFDK